MKGQSLLETVLVLILVFIVVTVIIVLLGPAIKDMWLELLEIYGQ